MADASSTNTRTYRPIRSDSDVERFLKDLDALASWLDLRQKFFEPLIRRVEGNRQQWTHRDEFIRVAELLEYLPPYLESESFLSLLATWRKNPEAPFDAQEARARLHELLELNSFLENATTELGGERAFSEARRAQLQQRLEEVRDTLAGLIGAAATATDGDAEKIRQQTLDSSFPTLVAGLKTTKELLTAIPEQLKLDESAQAAWNQRGKERSKDELELLEKQADTAEKTELQLLEKELKQFAKEVLEGKNVEVANKVAQLQRETKPYEIFGLIGQQGLLEKSIEALRRENNDKLRDAILAFIPGRVSATSPQGPVVDTQQTMASILDGLKKLREELTKQRKTRIEKAEAAYSKAIRSLLGIVEKTEDSTLGEGGASSEDETAPLAQTGNLLVDAIAAWQAVALAWRERATSRETLLEKHGEELEELLGSVSLREAYLEASSFAWQDLFTDRSPEQLQRLQETAAVILRILDSYEPPIPQPEEAAQEKPPTDSNVPTPLQTALTQQQVQEQPTTNSGKLREIGKVSRDKATLDAVVLQQLREVLKSYKLTEEQIEQQLALYRATLSSEVWMALLQAGVLEQEIVLDQFVQIQVQFVQKYADIILRQKAVFDAQQIQRQLFEIYAQHGAVPSEVLANMQPNRLKEVLSYTKQLNSLSPEQRLAAVARLCQQELGFDPPPQMLAFFSSLTMGTTIAETGFLLDDLAKNYFRRPFWDELTPEEQTRIRQDIGRFYNHLEIFGVLFGLRDLQLLQQQLGQMQLYIQQTAGFAERLEALGQVKAVQFYRSLGEFTGQETTATPSTETEVSAATEAIEISATYYIIESLEVSEAQKRALEAFAIQQQLQGKVIDAATLSSIVARLQGDTSDYLDPELEASFGGWLDQSQSNPAAFQQAYSQQHEAMAYEGQQAQSSSLSQREKLMAAVKIAQAAATGPAGWAKLLADPNVRKLLKEELKKKAPFMVVGAAPGLAAGKVIGEFISNPVGFVTNSLLGVNPLAGGGAALGAEAVKAAGAGVSEAASSAQVGIGKEATAALNRGLEGTSQIIKNTQASIGQGLAELGVGKALAWTVTASMLGPILFSAFLTIIVITVIGGSLNDLPFGLVRTGFYEGTVCWPTNGSISQLDTAAHLTSPNGSAIDIARGIGEPIFSPFPGTVANNTRNLEADGYGYSVRLEADDGFTIVFAHLADPSSLQQGDRVEAGNQIGIMGNTGNSTGPHLHYEVISTSLRIRDILPSQPPLQIGATVSVGQCENFGTTPVESLLTVNAGGGGYAFVFNDGYDLVTAASYSNSQFVGGFGQANQLSAAINTNQFEGGNILGISSNGAGQVSYPRTVPLTEDTPNGIRQMEDAVLFIQGQSLSPGIVNSLYLPNEGRSRVRYNQNGVVMLDLYRMVDNPEHETVVREQILPLVEYAMSGTPAVMVNGQRENMQPYPADQRERITARTIFAWKPTSTGHEYALIVVRASTFWDMADVVNEVGFPYAVAMDGGGSSQLYVQGQDFSEAGGWLDDGGGWHPAAIQRSVPALFGVKRR